MEQPANRTGRHEREGERQAIQRDVVLPQPPLMTGLDGGRRDVDERVARGFRMIASTIWFVAASLEGTDYSVPLARHASRFNLRADALDEEFPAAAAARFRVAR